VVGNANYKKSNMYFLTSNKNVIVATTKTDIKYTFLQNISLYMRLTFLTADSTEYALLGHNSIVWETGTKTLDKFAASIFTVEE
jgi:hypothetical protein